MPTLFRPSAARQSRADGARHPRKRRNLLGGGGGSTPGVGTGDGGEAWSIRGTMNAKESESTSPSAKLPLSSLTLPHLTGMSVGHRLKAAASALKKPKRKKEGSTIAASKESGGVKKDDLEGHAAAGKKEAGVLQHLTAGLTVGAVAGGLSRSVVAPLERVKIEYMIDSGKVAAEGGMIGTLRRIVRTEGAVGLFRGNVLNVLRIAPTKAVELFAFDKYKEWR